MPRTLGSAGPPALSHPVKGAPGTKTLGGGTAPNETAAAVLAVLRQRLPGRPVGYTGASGDLPAVLRQRVRSANLQVIGAHLPGVEEAVRSGRHTADAHAACPVLVYGGPPPRPGPVLVAVDRDAGRHGVAEHGFAVAEMLGVPVRLVHAWAAQDDSGPAAAGRCPIGADTLLAEVVAAWEPAYHGLPVERQIVHHDDPAQALVQLGADASMLVMGARGGFLGAGPALGPTIAAVLGRTRCPVVVVPPRGRLADDW